MSTTNATKNSCNYKALLFLVTYSTATALLVLSPKSDAGEWVFTPRIETDLIFTDNAYVSPKNLCPTDASRLVLMLGIQTKPADHLMPFGFLPVVPEPARALEMPLPTIPKVLFS